MVKKLFPYLRAYRWRIAWALVQIILITGVDLLKPWPLQIVIDSVLSGKPVPVSFLAATPKETLLFLACLAIVAVQLAAASLVFLHNYTAIGIGQSMVNDLRGVLYAHLQRLSLAFHSRQRVGDLLYRVTADSFAIQTIIMNGALPIFSAILLLLGMLVILFPLDPLLTLLALGIIPLLFALISIVNRKILDLATEARQSESRVYSLVEWGMSAIRVVQSFTREEDEHRRFMGASRTSLDANLRLYNWQTFYSGAVGALVALGTAAVVYEGGRAVMSGRLSLGHLIVFVSYLAQLYQPVNQITQSWGLIAGAQAGARRVFEILDTESEIVEGTRCFPASGARGGVAWRGVGFRYRPQTAVLKGIDLEVPAGAKIAIVGATGAGKSTLLALLPRLYDPSAGVVEIDGVDVREYRLNALRSQIAMVLQPPLIFPLSVRENIAYGSPGADQAAIEKAVSAASLEDWIASLPEGYDTVLGEPASSLSEGEKQRITIARALLRDAPILILDEPSSALDVATEARVMETIEKLTRGRTAFIIAHRLSTVRRADRIILLSEGQIAEEGTFYELLARDGLFARLYWSQFAGAESVTSALVPAQLSSEHF